MPNVSESFPSLDGSTGRTRRFYWNQPGFSMQAWDGATVVASWLVVREHMMVRGTRPESWPDFLHAVMAPCFVIPNKPGKGGRPRRALYRLRPGLHHLFRVAVVQDEGDGLYLAVTAFPKSSIANDHYQALFSPPLHTCRSFALRRRDLHPAGNGARVPARWSEASADPPEGCCERDLGCVPVPERRSVAHG